MLLVLVLAGAVVAYVAFPHRGQQVPGAPWLGEAMATARPSRAAAHEETSRTPAPRASPRSTGTESAPRPTLRVRVDRRRGWLHGPIGSTCSPGPRQYAVLGVLLVSRPRRARGRPGRIRAVPPSRARSSHRRASRPPGRHRRRRGASCAASVPSPRPGRRPSDQEEDERIFDLSGEYEESTAAADRPGPARSDRLWLDWPWVTGCISSSRSRSSPSRSSSDSSSAEADVRRPRRRRLARRTSSYPGAPTSPPAPRRPRGSR